MHDRQIATGAELEQEKARFHEAQSNVPMDAIYKAYHMPARGTKAYILADLGSDLLGRGKSSRLYQKLVKQKKNIQQYRGLYYREL